MFRTFNKPQKVVRLSAAFNFHFLDKNKAII